jgi:tetratricopeptide (TPR) repeat protein
MGEVRWKGRLLFRLGVVAAVSVALGVALWAALGPGAGFDTGNAWALAGTLATLVAGLGAVWAQAVPSPDAPEPAPVPSRAPNTGTLRGVKRFFSDRNVEVAYIEGVVRAAADQGQISEAFIIYGMPGVGKSEFALRVAHKIITEFDSYVKDVGLEMLPRGVEFHGDEGLSAKDPAEALRALLNSIDRDDRWENMSLDELSEAWRNKLHGKFLILLLDNVSSGKQVLPLVPGGSSYVVLATGRSISGLTESGLIPYQLKVFDISGSVELIRNIIDRPVDEVDLEAIEKIARLYEYLPLAITISVSKFIHKRSVSFAEMLARLESSVHQMVDEFEYSDKDDGRVTEAFGFSYEQLPDDAKLVLRRLSLAPVPVVNAEEGAALAGLPVRAVRAALHRLEEESLIEEAQAEEPLTERALAGLGLTRTALAGESSERYRLHDLIRRYGRSLTKRDGAAANQEAVYRLVSYYQSALISIDDILTRQQPPRPLAYPVPTVSRNFADRPSAVAWARAERSNLLECAVYLQNSAQGSGQRSDQVWFVLFVSALSGLLRNEGLWQRSIELQTQAASVAGQLGVPLAVANALSERALLYRLSSKLADAVDDLERAIVIYRTVGGRDGLTGEAHALNTYGVVLDQQRKRAEGLARLAAALDIYRQLAHGLGQANVLHDQGMAMFFAKDDEQAIELIRQALTLYETVGHPLGAAHAHKNLARAERRAGLMSEAADSLEAARAGYLDLRNLLGVIDVSIQRGVVLRDHDNDEAARMLHQAFQLSTELGSRMGQINALDELGELYRATGSLQAAAKAWSQALEIVREYRVEREETDLAGKIIALGLPGELS